MSAAPSGRITGAHWRTRCSSGARHIGALIVANNNNNSGRFLVGGQAGYNWQINNFVLGMEGDGDVAVGRTDNFPGFLNPRTNTGFFATVRGRGGIAFDRFLVYGTGGVAFGARRVLRRHIHRHHHW